MGYFWKNTDADNDANNLNNWNANEDGSGAAPGGLAGQDLWFTTTASIDDCIVSANLACSSVSSRTDETGGTDNGSNIFDIGIYNLGVNTALHFDGKDAGNKFTFKMGISAANGLNCVGLHFHSANVIADLQPGSKVNQYGDYFCANGTIFLNNHRGTYTVKDDGNYQSQSQITNHWYNFTVDATKTLTLVNTLSVITGINSNSVIINGDIDCNGQTLIIGGQNVLTLGANYDLIGSSLIRFQFKDTTTYTNNKSGAPSFTGLISMNIFATSTVHMAITGDFSNANYEIRGKATNETMRFTSGTLKCIDFEIYNDQNGNITVDANTNNPDFERSGDIDYNAGAGTYTTIYNKGSGTDTLNGANQSVDYNEQDVEAPITSGSGTKTFTAAFTSANLTNTSLIVELKNGVTTTLTDITFSGGTLQSASAGNKATLYLVNNAIVSNTTFKDIHTTIPNKINAKNDTNVNSGNLLGILFNDVMRVY